MVDQPVRRSTVQRLSHCWAPDARARVTGRWVDYTDASWFVLLRVLLLHYKRSDRLFSALVLLYLLLDYDGGLQLSLCLLTLPGVVCPIFIPWNCSFVPLPLFCRVDVVEFGADAVRCLSMRADAVDAVYSHIGEVTSAYLRDLRRLGLHIQQPYPPPNRFDCIDATKTKTFISVRHCDTNCLSICRIEMGQEKTRRLYETVWRLDERQRCYPEGLMRHQTQSY